jgi:hypothetical protein
MPRPVFDDNDENEVEVQVTRHGAVGYMKRWKENILYGKIRQSGLTLGPVAEGVDGGLYNQLPFIQF